MSETLFERTKQLDCHVYIDYTGEECTRQDLLDEARDGWAVVVAYVGGGFCPLVVGVGTVSTPGAVDYCGVYETVRIYLGANRPDELVGDDDEGRWLPEEHTFQLFPGLE